MKLAQHIKQAVTHAGELLSEIKKTKVVKFEDSHYTVDGVKATIVDPFDGQKYELTIKPLYRKDNTDPQRN